MHEHVCATSVCLNTTQQPEIQPPDTYSLAFLLLPALICYNAVFHAGLTCHSRPHSPTYPDILFRVRLNLRPSRLSVCDVHSGNIQQVSPCDLDWLLKLQALSTASFLKKSHFIPWHLTLRHRSEFSEIAVERKQGDGVWASLLNSPEIHF